MVRSFMRYKRVAKNSPTSTKHIDAPKGSSMTELSPPSTNFAGIPMTVSAPNHVAKLVVITMYRGREWPATAKSSVFLTRVPAHAPIARVPSKYRRTKTSNSQFIHHHSNPLVVRRCLSLDTFNPFPARWYLYRIHILLGGIPRGECITISYFWIQEVGS